MKGHWISYTPEETAWLETNSALVIGDYHRAFCETFGRDDVSAANLHALRKRKGWRTGRTGCFNKGATPHNKGKTFEAGRSAGAARNHFKKGGLPHNTNYLGHERVSVDGYVEISIDEVNPHTGFERRYVLKHRHLWEAINGPVPDGMCLKSLDGDKTNTAPSNWEAIPRGALPFLNGGRASAGLNYNDVSSQAKPAVLTLAKLKYARSRVRANPAGIPVQEG